MRTLLTRLSAGLVAFLVGVVVVAVIFRYDSKPAANAIVFPQEAKPATQASVPVPVTEQPVGIGEPIMPAEDKAVIVAEEFIRRNGYTTQPPDRNNLSHETIETAESIDGILADRYNTLEPNAYGFVYGRKGKSGYTVLFRYTNRTGDSSKEAGRAVTMDENFGNLRVEHQDFFLNKVEKKLR
ncbi:MAG TPA: hypothetical protein VFA21_10485 [Pyrinomonadaceae bacterium]|nr:hypothetical protein [Pyrinomonadaceae bacterium]